jgi:sulfotransferase
MVQKIYYNASMPRAGSTLIQNILMQNPDIHSTPTSGVIEFLLNARSVYSAGDTFKAQDQEEMKAGFKNFCKTGLYGFFDGITDRPYVMDKSRGWLGHFNFIEFFTEEKPKMIVMVRDLRAIFASMEKNFRKHPDKDPMIINGVELKNMTTAARVDHFSVAPPIGPSMEWLSEAIHQGIDKDILFIRFEDLTADPETELKKIYQYLELPYFKHDFNNVEQLTHENDVIHGIFGDHEIQPQVKPVKDNFIEILGKEQCDRLRQHYDWYFTAFNYI